MDDEESATRSADPHGSTVPGGANPGESNDDGGMAPPHVVAAGETSGDGGMAPGYWRGASGERDGGMLVAPGDASRAETLPLDASLEDRLPMLKAGDLAELGQLPLVLGVPYRDAAWDPVLLAQPILAAFAKTEWDKITLERPDNTPGNLAEQIKQLLKLQRHRRARLGEIIGQANGQARYWAQTMAMGPVSHPKTWTLLASAMAIAHLVGMYFKAINNRPRPSQVYPALVPAISVPPHPSYPSGHALHASLICGVLSDACPALMSALDKLKVRIAVNREIAGVHFPDDKTASFALANGILPLLRALPIYQDALAAAKLEWPTDAIKEGEKPGAPNGDDEGSG